VVQPSPARQDGDQRSGTCNRPTPPSRAGLTARSRAMGHSIEDVLEGGLQSERDFSPARGARLTSSPRLLIVEPQWRVGFSPRGASAHKR
jgi:hypothetical protein